MAVRNYALREERHSNSGHAQPTSATKHYRGLSVACRSASHEAAFAVFLCAFRSETANSPRYETGIVWYNSPGTEDLDDVSTSN